MLQLHVTNSCFLSKETLFHYPSPESPASAAIKAGVTPPDATTFRRAVRESLQRAKERHGLCIVETAGGPLSISEWLNFLVVWWCMVGWKIFIYNLYIYLFIFVYYFIRHRYLCRGLILNRCPHVYYFIYLYIYIFIYLLLKIHYIHAKTLI